MVRRLNWVALVGLALSVVSCAPGEDASKFEAPAKVERKADDGGPVYSAEESSSKAAMPK